MDGLLEMRGITKVYGNGIVANSNVDIQLNAGEIHAIAGENGAGKSTIMKVLYGLERPDAGEIILRGRRVDIHSPRRAQELGIGMVQQHFMLVRQLPVYENIFLGQEVARAGWLAQKKMVAATLELGRRYGIPVNPLARCGALNVSMAQRVEILKLLAREARLLILDEPTAVLTPQETAELFAQLRLLRDEGRTCVIITHKLREITQLCDRVTVMRAGRTVGVFPLSEVDADEISRLMVGRDVKLTLEKAPAQPGGAALEARALTVPGPGGAPAVNKVSFTLRRGEILCLAGVEGNGQREVVQCLTGLRKGYGGTLLLDGRDIARLGIRAIRACGLAHIPEDRMAHGINGEAGILENLISVNYRRHTRAGFIRYRLLAARADEQIKRYHIKAAGHGQRITMLSGGTIQKVVAAREMDEQPAVLVADQPTRGVDVGAMELIHNRLVEMRDAGCAILLVSADMSEVFNLSDRILVFHEGRVAAEVTDVKALSEEQLGRYMLGLDSTTGEGDRGHET